MTDTTASTPLKRTPLRDVHVKAGAKMVPFGGWDMPVQYTGIIDEHRAVRRGVGLFDISHMGEFEVRGPDALAAVQRLCTNDARTLEIGQVQYAALCYPEGGIVDDLTVYRLAADHYMLVVNASNIDKDWTWVTSHSVGRQPVHREVVHDARGAGTEGGSAGGPPRRPRRHRDPLLPL